MRVKTIKKVRTLRLNKRKLIKQGLFIVKIYSYGSNKIRKSSDKIIILR